MIGLESAFICLEVEDFKGNKQEIAQNTSIPLQQCFGGNNKLLKEIDQRWEIKQIN
jgi:hypothetical protein